VGYSIKSLILYLLSSAFFFFKFYVSYICVRILFTACLVHRRAMQNFGMDKFIFRKVNVVEVIQLHEYYCDVELSDQRLNLSVCRIRVKLIAIT
jgi:hypothetical protein